MDHQKPPPTTLAEYQELGATLSAIQTAMHDYSGTCETCTLADLWTALHVLTEAVGEDPIEMADSASAVAGVLGALEDDDDDEWCNCAECMGDCDDCA